MRAAFSRVRATVAARAPSPRVLAPAALACAIALSPALPAHASELEGLFKRAANRLKHDVLRTAEDRIVDTAQKPIRQAADGTTPQETSASASASVGGGTLMAGQSWQAPRADRRIGDAPQGVWFRPGRGHKFEPMQETPRQIVATNPYLSTDAPFFGSMSGLQCAADGSLVLAGDGGLDADGGVAGTGWWRIASDGAITPLVTRPLHSPGTIYPSADFSVTPDGTLLTSTRDAVLRISPDGQAHTVLAGMDEPGMPVQDPSGNIWVADKEHCELRRIASDGTDTTVVGPERVCSEQPAQDRINLANIAWDPVHGELVAGGGRIVARPAHDMHITLWRIRPDGQARRVYYTVKAGRSPIAQNTDTIWSMTVDDQGRIVVATRLLDDRARRQIMRLDEARGKLVVLTGQSFAKAFGFSDYRAGHEEAPYDGAAAHASFREAKNICYGPDRTLFVLDDHLVRRFDTDGTVRTWAY